jgi:hypothetical protein
LIPSSRFAVCLASLGVQNLSSHCRQSDRVVGTIGIAVQGFPAFPLLLMPRRTQSPVVASLIHGCLIFFFSCDGSVLHLGV